MREPNQLHTEAQEALTTAYQVTLTAALLYELVQEFRHLLHHWEGQHLAAWCAKVAASQMWELRSLWRAGNAMQVP